MRGGGAEPLAQARPGEDPTLGQGDLFDLYEPEAGFLFERGGDGIVGVGQARQVVVPAGPGLVGRASLAAQQTLAEMAETGSSAPLVVVGALPFGDASSATLSVPEQLIRRAHQARADGPDPIRRRALVAATAFPSREEFLVVVSDALGRIGAGQLEKVVVARTLVVDAAKPFDARSVARRLRMSDPGSFVFAAPSARPGVAIDGDARVVVGASPERLVRRRGLTVEAAALGGSTPRSASSGDDEEAGRRLLGSSKDRREHALVVDAVAAALEPFCDSLSVPAEPSLVGTSTVWHLSSDVSGHLRDPSVSALSLAAALHPTPAVCGTPTPAARAAIAELEGFDRGPYAGLVGWVDAAGDGEWAVVLRCAELNGCRARLYAGAGVVVGSDPEAEAAETDAKFAVMLAALSGD